MIKKDKTLTRPMGVPPYLSDTLCGRNPSYNSPFPLNPLTRSMGVTPPPP